MGYEFVCVCGQWGSVWTDNRSYAAHILPEKNYEAFSSLVDHAIENSGPSDPQSGDKCMAWRRFLHARAFQCPACGSVYVEDHTGGVHRFSPTSDDTPKRLFAGPSTEPPP